MTTALSEPTKPQSKKIEKRTTKLYPVTTETVQKANKQIDTLLLTKIKTLIWNENNCSITYLAKELDITPDKLYVLLSSDLAPQILGVVGTKASLLANRSLQAIEKMLELQDSDDPEIRIKVGTIAKDYVISLMRLYQEAGVKDTEDKNLTKLSLVLAQTMKSILTRDKAGVETEFSVEDNKPEKQ